MDSKVWVNRDSNSREQKQKPNGAGCATQDRSPQINTFLSIASSIYTPMFLFHRDCRFRLRFFKKKSEMQRFGKVAIWSRGR
jgi:hypothetical protein